MPRLVLVYNPNSTNFTRVKKEILNQKTELFENYDLAEYTIKQIGFDTNVKNLGQALENGDICLSLGGDATAAITANAILDSKKDVTLSVLPYGNFNDLARTLGTMKLKSLKGLGNDAPETVRDNGSGMSEEPRNDGRDEASRGNIVPSPQVTSLYPLEIYVNDNLWRFATCYVTIGMTAEAVELFDEAKFRKYMKKGHKSSWRSYLALAKWYFKHRHQKTFLPEFTINGQKSNQNASDYAAVNGKSMCRVMRGGDDYKKTKIFRSANIKTVSFPKLFMLMARSILHRVPGRPTTGDILEFKTPAEVELQAEGEYQVFENVKKIEVKKGTKCLKVITKN